MRLLLFVFFVLFVAPLWAGESGTGLDGPPGTPEPSTIGLLGAAVLVGVPAWYYRRFCKKATQDEEHVTAQ
jgi:hypothetical protein